jgi:hypothetical protein
MSKKTLIRLFQSIKSGSERLLIGRVELNINIGRQLLFVFFSFAFEGWVIALHAT